MCRILWMNERMMIGKRNLEPAENDDRKKEFGGKMNDENDLAAG